MRHDLDPKYNIVHYICMYDCILYSFLPINRCNNQLKICTKESRNHGPKEQEKTLKINQVFTHICNMH